MSDSPEEIRAEIERTRRELGGDVDALADKVSPTKIMDRQRTKVTDALGSMRDRVMGSAEDAGSSLAHMGSSAAGGVGDVKDKIVDKTQGNPMAVGLIAFGVGLLVASLIPASSKEKDLADTVKDQAQPLVDEVVEAAKDVGEHLKVPAQDAATAVKEAATDSFESVKDETRSAKDEIKDSAATSGSTAAER